MTLETLALELSVELGMDPRLILAIATVESGKKQWPCRYEPAWKYFKDTELWAKHLGQSEYTERVQQATSWGPMQVMGAVARELGFKGYLSQMAVTEIGMRYGCLKLREFTRKYYELEDAIASYNAGSPRKGPDGKYSNQAYVDKVMKAFKAIE